MSSANNQADTSVNEKAGVHPVKTLNDNEGTSVVNDTCLHPSPCYVQWLCRKDADHVPNELFSSTSSSVASFSTQTRIVRMDHVATPHGGIKENQTSYLDGETEPVAATTTIKDDTYHCENQEATRSPRVSKTCISASFVITAGILLALTFVMIGLGKALLHSNMAPTITLSEIPSFDTGAVPSAAAIPMNEAVNVYTPPNSVKDNG